MAEQLLKSKNVLLTGASRGIGSAIAELYAKHGEGIISNCSGCVAIHACHHKKRSSLVICRVRCRRRPFNHTCGVMQVPACT